MNRFWLTVSISMIVLAGCQTQSVTQPTSAGTERNGVEPTSAPSEQASQEPTLDFTEIPEGAITDFENLQMALRNAGATINLMDPMVQTVFAVRGYGMTVNGENLVVYEYTSPDELQADVEKVFPVSTWPSDTYFWKAGSVLVQYQGSNQDLIALMTTIMGPQIAGGQGNPDVAVIGSFEDFQAALAALGVSVQLGDPTVGSMFAGNGYSFDVNGENLQVFEYDTPAAMEADAAKLSPDASTFNGGTVDWGPTPMHFWKSGNFLVVYGGSNADVIALMASLLGAEFATSQ